MINDLIKKVKLLEEEQERVNNSYNEKISKIQNQIEEANKKTISIGLPMYCDIINALSTGMPAKDLADQLIKIGQEQCKDLGIMENTKTNENELKGIPTREPRIDKIDMDVDTKNKQAELSQDIANIIDRINNFFL